MYNKVDSSKGTVRYGKRRCEALERKRRYKKEF